MKGSLPIARFAGIPVKVHWSFALLIIWVMLASVTSGYGFLTALVWLAIVAVLFICVILHEYGHALTARRFGVSTRDIVLTPVGGIARLERIPESPRAEILVALAGPAVNLVIGVVLLGIYLALRDTPVDLISSAFWTFREESSLVATIAKINLILVIFNMIPAFPMDGGRVLRASLAFRYTHLRATEIASYIGKGFAAVLVVVGVYFGDFILPIIGIFVFFAAGRELAATRIKMKLRGIHAGEICDREPPYVYASQKIADVPEIDHPWAQGDFLVFSEDRMEGVLFAEAIEEARKMGIEEQPVRTVASDLYAPLHHNLNARDIVNLFIKKGYRICPVFKEDRLIGAVYRSHLEHLIREKPAGDLNK